MLWHQYATQGLTSCISSIEIISVFELVSRVKKLLNGLCGRFELISSYSLAGLSNGASFRFRVKINTHNENKQRGEESTCSGAAPLNFHSLQRFCANGLLSSSVALLAFVVVVAIYGDEILMNRKSGFVCENRQNVFKVTLCLIWSPVKPCSDIGGNYILIF